MQLVQHAIDKRDVAILGVDGTILVQKDSVILTFAVGQLMVVDGGQRKLSVLISPAKRRDKVCGISFSLCIVTVDNCVQHDDLPYRVKFSLVSKSVPRGFADQALGYQVLQVIVNRLVGKGEARVVATCRQKLIDGRLTLSTHRHQLRQFEVLRVFRMCFKVTGNSVLREDITRRRVNLL